MIKTFVIPSLPSILSYVAKYIAGILCAHFIFEQTNSTDYLLVGCGALAVITFFLFFTKRGYFYSLLFLLGGLARTSYTLYSYKTYTPQASSPIEIIDITVTGNPVWPFSIKLQQNNYNFLLYTKIKPYCSINTTYQTFSLFKKPIYNDFCRYLLKEHTVATAFSYKFNGKVIKQPFFSITRYLQAVRDNILHSVTQKSSAKTAALFSSLCLGNKKIFKKELKHPKLYFRSWGIVHHLARSGLHLIIILFVWYLILSVIPLSYRTKTCVISSIATIFALFSFDGISFTRSLFVFFITQFLIYSKEQTNSLHTLTLVAFIFLLSNPFLIFSLDFQLSFFVTFFLCLFSLLNRQKRVNCSKLLLSDYRKA